MLIEMHAHTSEHSTCSSVSAADLVAQVFAKGLQGVVLTDHHYLWQAEELKALRLASHVPDHFLIMAGQEVQMADYGDVLVYGADVALPRGISLAEASQLYPQAALVWAHPYRSGRIPAAVDLVNPLWDGIEIFNSNHTVRGNSRGLQDWHRHRFTALAGTDTHGKSYAGTYPTYFDHPFSTIVELASEIRNGRCRPFFKEIPHAGANSQVTEVTFGTKGIDESRERIIIKTLDDSRKWQSAERAFKIMAAIADHGFSTGRYRVPKPIDEDPATMTLIEQGMRGKSLYDKLLTASIADGQEYLQLAGRWLARLHSSQIRMTPMDEFSQREQKRLANYLSRFEKINHRHTRKAREIMEAVHEGERRLLDEQGFVQGHGDYHPKNVFIGQDSQDNRETLYVAAIDFESSLVMPPAFDVGCFLAQYRNQFFSQQEKLREIPESIFLNAYLADAAPVGHGFHRQVELFRARTNLSIAAYLIKLGLGESEDLWRVLVEAEQALSWQ